MWSLRRYGGSQHHNHFATACLGGALALVAGALGLVEKRALGRALGAWPQVPIAETPDKDEPQVGRNCGGSRSPRSTTRA